MTINSRLKEDAQAAAKKKRAQPSRNGKRRKGQRKKTTSVEDDDENGFHFVVYVPAHGKIWKLDDMEKLPQTLGDLDKESNWLVMVIADL
jgi:hypothetical protein